MELGKKIRQLRFRASLTQEQLAEKLGVAPQSVSKWENAVAMPDISTLPLLAEVFGVTIDDLFDLSAEQRLNRIENRLDVEDELSQDLFWEYEEFLKGCLAEESTKKRAVELLAYLHWHRMNADAGKVRRYAQDALRAAPDEKGCQWMLARAAGHAVWDWNVANHHKAVDFYRELAEQNPESRLPLCWLIDNLLADRRADEAEAALEKLRRLPGVNSALLEAYAAWIALARFDEPAADRIVEAMTAAHPDRSDDLFEAAQYYAGKCDYEKAVALYEASFEKEPKRPRFIDALMAVADIREIQGDYRAAAAVWDRIVEVQRSEWGQTEEVELKDSIRERNRLLEKAK